MSIIELLLRKFLEAMFIMRRRESTTYIYVNLKSKRSNIDDKLYLVNNRQRKLTLRYKKANVVSHASNINFLKKLKTLSLGMS